MKNNQCALGYWEEFLDLWGPYLHKHDHAFPQNLTDKHFVVIVPLEDLLFQELACCQVEGFSGSVEPAAIEPPLSFTQKAHVTN